MRKMTLIALLLALMLMLSGCALVTVDEAKDNARVIVDVDGETVKVPAVKEFPMVLECKVVYKQLQDENAISPDDLEKNYPKDASGKRDIHWAITGEITKAYILE